nr:replication protein A 70 kDa DNA-binding subunit C-like [Arachis hypogaea]
MRSLIFRYDLIKCINAGPAHKVWKLKVRVIRLWTVSQFAKSGMKAPIEMVVLDEEGDTIQCTVKDIFVPIFEGLLAEGNVYVVTNFGVALNTIKFKPTRHEFRIHFKRDTIVHPVQDSSFPLNRFNFVPFKTIQSESKEDGYLVDVIGQLASKGNLVEFTRDGKPSSYITIELDDLEGGQKLRVTLWQSFAFDLLKYLEEHPCLTYVVILQMGKMKFYTGVMGVSNTNYNLKLFINVEFPAARDFFARVNKLDPVDGQGIMPLVCDQPVSVEKDFLRLSVYKTIAEIKEYNQAGRLKKLRPSLVGGTKDVRSVVVA